MYRAASREFCGRGLVLVGGASSWAQSPLRWRGWWGWEVGPALDL